VDSYGKVLATMASVTAYAVMARELLPPELRAAAARWASSAPLELLGRAKKERCTLVVRSQQGAVAALASSAPRRCT
jgi:chaperone BCS1